MAFDMGLAVRWHGAMVQGRPLADGWDIFALRYLHARLFNNAAKTEASWSASRAQLGFERFTFMGEAQYGGRAVAAMPRSDFMLVALAWITGRDARPCFREHGVRFSDLQRLRLRLATRDAVSQGTSQEITRGVSSLQPGSALADAQVQAMVTAHTLGRSAVVLETDLAPSDTSATARVTLDETAAWPRDNGHPSRCVR